MKEKLINLLNEKRIRLLLLATGGILTGLMLVFPQAGFLQWITMVPAAIAFYILAEDEKIRLRGLYGYGLFYFMCYYPVVYHWFANLYPLEFIDGMTPFVALAIVLLGVFGLSLLQALMGGLVFVVLGFIFRSKLVKKASVIKPFAAASLWAVFEWTQTLGWIGVPWGRLALGQTYHEIAFQSASLFGSYFISFLIVAVNFCLAFVILKLIREELPRIKLPVICVVAMLVFQYGVGSALYFSGNIEAGAPVKVAAVQGNMSSNEKWKPSSTSKTYNVYSKYSLEAAKEGADIILWPESALPFSLEEGKTGHEFVSSLAVECGVPIVAGGFRDHKDGAEFNALVCFMPDGRVLEDFYAKRHLVPFGEYVPLEGLIRFLFPPLAELIMGDMVLVPGEGAQLIDINGLSVGPLICFDSIYESLALESVRDGAEVIFVSTNDSWFTDSAALDMHNAQARLRAVECGRYVVRAANTGISSVITPRGEIVESLGALEGGIIIGEIYPRNTVTLYSVIGNLFVYMCIFGNFALVVAEFVRRYSENKLKKH